jgi:hypothetical protein
MSLGQEGTKEMEILIVEDSPTQAERLKYILEQHGYQISVARHGREALAFLSQRRPQLVLSDIIMPEMDGYQLCQQIKGDGRLKDIPVMLLTTLSDPEDVVQGLECGADNFLTKPCDEQHLLSRIQFILVNRQLQQTERAQMGVKVFFAGREYFITSDRLQILNLLLSTYETAVQKNRELSQTRDELRRLNESLEKKVEERTATLRAEIAERERAEAEIRRLNEDLERRVSERTRQLEAANQELEAFSYSVSRDLRAPLRAIDGFSQILLADYPSRLDAEGQRLLKTIRANTRRMGQLIDDLLAFSRLSRQGLERATIEMAALARSVMDELRRLEPARELAATIQDLPSAQGDRAMIRQVFANLISNAWKYTRGRPRPVIEIGWQRSGPETIYYVRDNGAGFEMQYADKLFQVFQRLHSGEEFEGTGVGLAIVERIIHRHGGRVWAAGKVGEGATFFFTLPGSESPT